MLALKFSWSFNYISSKMVDNRQFLFHSVYFFFVSWKSLKKQADCEEFSEAKKVQT